MRGWRRTVLWTRQSIIESVHVSTRTLPDSDPVTRGKERRDMSDELFR